MAVIDTGLGWSADENWLKRYDGQLGQIKGLEKPEYFSWQPINVNSTMNSSNYYNLAPVYGNEIASHEDGNSTGRMYALADKPGCYVAREGTTGRWYAFGTDPNAYVAWVHVRSTSTVVWYTRQRVNGDSSYPPLYFAQFTRAIEFNDYIIPTYNKTKEEYIADFTTVLKKTYKLAADGYAIACMVKWYDFDYLVHNSSILISTVPANTDQSLDGTTSANAPTGRYLYDGGLFTLSMIDVPGAQYTVTSQVIYRDLLSFGKFTSVAQLFEQIARMASIEVTETDDPYNPVTPSGEEGGGGDFDGTDDGIPMSSLPTLSFASTGFCRVYSPTLSQLSALATYMWTDQTFLQTLANHIIQLLENPMESIISLSLVPCSPAVGPAESVKVLFIPIPDVSMYPVTDQFKDVDCGTLAVNEYYGSALDYNPYTKISCFLPFIGMVELDTDEVMGKTLSIVYRIDVVSGACTAIIMADGDVLYQFSGHCSVQMPVTAADFSSYISALMSTAKLVAGLGASAAGAPVLGGAILGAPPIGSKSTSVTEISGGEVALSVRNPDTGRQVTAGKVSTSPQTKVTTHTPGGMNFGELTVRSTVNTVGAVMNSKAGVQHSGGFSGISGYLGLRYPYLIIKRPRLCNPSQYGQYNGRPSMIYASLGDCTGYTEVQSIQLTGIPATNPEMSEIAELLKSGVIL